MMMTLIVEASHDGERQSSAASFLVGVQLEHRRRHDVFEPLFRVLQRSPPVVVQVGSRVREGLEVVRRALPVGAGALEDGHQQPDARQNDGVFHRRAAISRQASLYMALR